LFVFYVYIRVDVLEVKLRGSATATGQQILTPTFAERGVLRGQRGGTPMVVNHSFLDRNRYPFFQTAPHLSSQGLSGPHSSPTATQKIW
jgi:hypothetical protein